MSQPAGRPFDALLVRGRGVPAGTWDEVCVPHCRVTPRPQMVTGAAPVPSGVTVRVLHTWRCRKRVRRRRRSPGLPRCAFTRPRTSRGSPPTRCRSRTPRRHPGELQKGRQGHQPRQRVTIVQFTGMVTVGMSNGMRNATSTSRTVVRARGTATSHQGATERECASTSSGRSGNRLCYAVGPTGRAHVAR